MLSDHDRRALAEIERYLEEDRRLCRSFRGAAVRPGSRIRRFWWAVLVVSLVLTLGLAVLDVLDAALESAVVAAVAWTALRLTRPTPEGCVGRGAVPNRKR